MASVRRPRGDGTVATGRSSCTLGILVPKVYNFTSLLVVSFEMAPKIKGGKGRHLKQKVERESCQEGSAV